MLQSVVARYQPHRGKLTQDCAIISIHDTPHATLGDTTVLALHCCLS